MNKPILIFLVVLSAFLFSACSGCDEDDCFLDCADGEVCSDGLCVNGGRACGEGCPTGQECVSRQCIVTSAQCSEFREECDPTRQVADGFLCIDLEGAGAGECLVNCETDGSCGSGSLCFFVEGPLDAACSADEDCESGTVCRLGQCRGTVCRPSECEGFLTDDESCATRYDGAPGFSDGAICGDFGNDASFCFPAGPRQLGEACTTFIDAVSSNEFTNTCGTGLGCVDDACVVACVEDVSCENGEVCLLADENILGAGIGFCGEGCEPFSEDDCGASGTCLPVAAGAGVCVDSGESQIFEACVPGERSCEQGTLCVQLQGGNANAGLPVQARCLPLCDATVGEGNADGGAVGDLEQALRDASCPNSEPPPAYFALVNLSTVAVDIYFGAETTPRATALSPGAHSDADSGSAGTQYFELPSGALDYRVLVAGAPSTDSPLAASTLALTAGTSTILQLASQVGASDTLLVSDSLATPSRVVEPTQHDVLWIQASEDLGAVDVISVPAGDDLSVPANQVELHAGLSFGDSIWVSQIADEARDILVFDTGADRSDRLNVLLSIDAQNLAAGQRSSVAFGGTRDLGDLADLGMIELTYLEPADVEFSGPAFSCVDLNNGLFGYCQQTCGEGTSGYGADLCEGPNMGCAPALVEGPRQWKNVCGPVGIELAGEPCNPSALYGECAEGLYCQEFGNTAPNHDPAQRGFCNSLCVEDDIANPVLSCAPAESCRPLDFGPDFSIGACAHTCTPDPGYGDMSCPAGQQACLPNVALIDDSGGTNPPSAQTVQSYCGVSGDIAVGTACFGSDCVAGSECLFPRSQQFDFVTTLFSPYVGAAGLEATCTPQCDPFDGADGPAQCESGETCLFNYPLNAEVGHCAPITDQVAPGSPCVNPGEACGADSICLVNGDAPVCFEFCEYANADAQGMFLPETCSAGFVCVPLGNDVGVCLAP